MKKRYPIILLLVMLLSTSCEKLQYDDPSTFTLEEALKITPDYYFKVAASSLASSMLWSNDAIYSTSGFSLLADQMTTHNGSYQWIDFNREPRTPLNTSSTYGGRSVIFTPYQMFYQSNLNATKVIEGLDKGNPGVDSKGVVRTDEVYAIAHLVKGISQGNLGATYDRGLIVDQDRSLAIEQAYPNSYKELIENAVKHLDLAIVHANLAPKIKMDDFYGNMVADKSQFIRYANSLAARFLASIPRDKEEAKALGPVFWRRVLDYAEKGLTDDFTTVPYGGVGTYYNYSTYYLSFLVSGLPYLPMDIKIAYFADNTGTYPDAYPTDNTVLGPVKTDDQRFAQYFRYYSGFGGYVEASLGRQMFSNYGRIRWGDGANAAQYVQRQVVMLSEEVRMLRAEAKFWANDLEGAAAELNDPKADRIAKGKLKSVPATEAAIRYVLHYEWAISIDVVGGNLGPFAFMRRNNLLRPGTPTEFPITQNQTILTNTEPYTFGGIENAGKKGIFGEVSTAGNDWGWMGKKVNF